MKDTLRVVSALVAGLLMAGAAAQAEQRPNILFIYLDDYGWRDAGFAGSDFYETPHIDALAAGGMVFSSAYAGAANCAPSRACLLSGQYSPRHEIYNVGTRARGSALHRRLEHVPGTAVLRPDIVTWAHAAKDAGYATASIGKWHLSADPRPHGFDLNIAGTHSGSPPRGYFPPHPGVPGVEHAPKDEYLTDRLTDEALGFIEAQGEKPWLLYLTHFAVHTPLQAKEEDELRFKNKPPGELHDHAVMAGMIKSVDDGVGRLVALLEASGLRERTVILFYSDNGGYGPATSMHPLRGYKGTYYEGGIRVPFFVNWPGVVEPASSCDTPITAVDLHPTIREIIGAKEAPDQEIDGLSIVPLLEGGELPERAIYWHFPAYLQSYSRIDEQPDPLFRARPCGVMRRGDWKLIEYFEDGRLELFNLAEDIGESRNLASDRSALAAKLHRQMQVWRERTGAPLPSRPNPLFDAEAERTATQRAIRKSRK